MSLYQKMSTIRPIETAKELTPAMQSLTPAIADLTPAMEKTDPAVNQGKEAMGVLFTPLTKIDETLIITLVYAGDYSELLGQLFLRVQMARFLMSMWMDSMNQRLESNRALSLEETKQLLKLQEQRGSDDMKAVREKEERLYTADPSSVHRVQDTARMNQARRLMRGKA